jgi:4-azaleucine resistance transporter AzlC
VVAADRARGLERADAAQARGGGEAHALGQLDVAEPPVFLELAQYCAVHGIHVQIMPQDPARRTILRDAAGVGVAVGVYGVSFGVLAVAAGASVAQAMALSLLVFTGASQFAFVGVIAGGGGAAAAVAPALMLAARNAIYGLSLAPMLTGSRVARLLQSQLVIDESTAMARAQDSPARARTAFRFTGLAVLVGWNAGTLAGALAGRGIGDPRDLGMDAMFPAAFLALLSPQLRRPGAPRAAVTGALIAAALVTLTPPGLPVVAAVGALVPAGLAARRRLVAA